MKQYQIVVNNGLPNAKINNFVDRVEAGIMVVELTNGVFYIEKSALSACGATDILSVQ